MSKHGHAARKKNFHLLMFHIRAYAEAKTPLLNRQRASLQMWAVTPCAPMALRQLGYRKPSEKLRRHII
jgi:hypothetical protein